MFLLSPFARRVQASFLSILLFAATLFPSAVILAAEPFSEMSPDQQMETMEEFFRAARAYRDTLSGEGYDPAGLVRRIGNDPQVLLDWVMENTVEVLYEGRLRSPSAVMMDGTGNSLDRAVFLARLLELGGHQVKLASAEVEPVPFSGGVPLRDAWLPPVQAIPDDAEDLDGLAQLSEMTSMFERRMERIAARMDTQIPVLHAWLETVESPRESPRFTPARIWWVVVGNNGEERILNPAGGEVPNPDTEVRVEDLDDALYQRVTFEVRVERRDENGFHTETALEHTLRPADYTHAHFEIGLMSDDLNLSLERMRELEDDYFHEVMRQMKESSNWIPFLEIGNDLIIQMGFDDKGVLNDNHLQSATGRAVTRATGALGGIGLRGADRRPQSLLTGVDLVFQWEHPGGEVRREVRRVYDVFPDDPARQQSHAEGMELSDEDKIVRGMALSRQSSVLMQTGFMEREFSSARQLDHLLASRPAMLGALHFEAGNNTAQVQASLENLNVFPEELYDWATTRAEFNPFMNEIFLAEANLVAWHTQPMPGEEGETYLRTGIDILGNRLKSTDGETEPVFMQGMVDALVESVIVEMRNPDMVSTSLLMERTGADAWIALGSRGDLEAHSFSPRIQHQLVKALEQGLVLMIPDSLGGLPYEETAWWELNPETGEIMGRIGEEGWGGGAAMYGAKVVLIGAKLVALLASMYVCHQNMSAACFICNYVGALLLVFAAISGPGAAVGLLFAGVYRTVGCGLAIGLS
ncbi:MAG: hypothetical protein JJU05_13280 [Verrucomicrobia bacterium]|nr:hypothetical protein [Verrucomicrobiota bacterium]MCH8527953.1 hypothetical protein [Kiritimatiellia bacterium]